MRASASRRSLPLARDRRAYRASSVVPEAAVADANQQDAHTRARLLVGANVVSRSGRPPGDLGAGTGEALIPRGRPGAAASGGNAVPGAFSVLTGRLDNRP